MQKNTQNRDFYSIFSRRSLVCFFVIICLFMISGIRVYEISNGEKYLAAQNSQSLFRENIAAVRGTVYDCNMMPITNNKKTYYAAVPPTPDAVVSVGDYLSEEERNEAIAKFKERKVAVCRPLKQINNKNVAQTDVYTTDYENFLFEHLVGYVGRDGHGSCGIEAAYDELLYSGEYASAVYRVSGTGYSLLGEKPYFDNDLAKVKDGVVLTLNKKIQQIVYTAGEKLIKGAIIIADVNTGKIRAMLSKPSFSPNDLSSAVKDKNSPFINRAVSPFAVGSVFKPCIAACLIDEGLKNTVCSCKGKNLIEGRAFYCHKRDGHGKVDLKTALAVSCNTYFYSAGVLLGGDKIRKSALLCNFGAPFDICKNISVPAGNLTKTENLKSNSQIANFSIGQGDILLSPVNMLTLYSAIAGNGSYYLPSVVEATIENGTKKEYNKGNKSTAMSQTAAAEIKEALREVVVSGTAKQAKSEKVSICGKTATAQTGRYNNDNREITNNWFCGFFPYENPQYVGVVMSEGTSEETPSQIFKEIAEKITEMYD